MTTLSSTVDARRQEWTHFRNTHPYRSLVTDGITWSYLIGGNGPETLLFLPGGLRIADAFFVILGELEHYYRVIAPSYPPVPTMEALVTGIAAILNAERVDRIDVLGESFGGEVAQYLVRQYPERVQSLILANTAPTHPHPMFAQPFRWTMTLSFLLPDPIVRALSQRLLLSAISAPSGELPFWRALIQEVVYHHLSRADIDSFFRETLDFHLHYKFSPADLANWSGRILILESADDRGIPRSSREGVKRLYPQAAVHTFECGGHTPWLTRADVYFSTIRGFLANNRLPKQQ